MTGDSFLTLEIDFERQIYQSKLLSLFRRSPSTWELLLYLAQFEEGSEDGVYNTLDRLRTRYLGNSAMLKFVRERRDDGLLQFTEHTKRSKWKVSLDAELRAALFVALEERNVGLQQALVPKEHRPQRG
ncbi:hypothetical protein [Pseudotabrizicola sp. 4114]|uniref:hypothetical protein n=1 Tax=Pseudotabrizicola sp. 4114 TaxID=2817731 RepID=UPI00285980B7|nr:hypothetical protein [Pseudorhodobacter sp. 4114]